MLNRIFKTILLGVFALAITTSFISCKKENATIAVIIVKDTNGNLVSGTQVELYPNQNINPVSGELPNSDLNKINTTDANGRTQFNYDLESILNIKATITIGNDNYEGVNIIRLLRGKTTTKVVEISAI
ncbi:MAG: hypothetical protein HN522_01015 [Flavobacteriales bacterium]|jgi:hypothetical protein|nr:hypothetical protein [Flavobacteriales bacterium]MBT5090226.1 hypothetical protein [Flavobacteriales bacterium]MBT5749834.1 hypothetical protein [Flavobacteriales bacterium]